MARRTKIVATIGPASGSASILEALLDKGVNVFRLNFSHGNAQNHRDQANTIRAVCQKKSIHAAILGDLQGPKIRIGMLANEPLTLKDDQNITLTVDNTKPATDTCIPVDYQALPQSVHTGDTLLLDDGLIRLTVQQVQSSDVICKVAVGGKLKSRKGLNRLGGGLSAPTITNKDYQDIKLAAELKLDYLAVSFPSCADDLKPVREQLKKCNVNIHIIAKIERAEAVESEETLKELILAADGVMVARGDLGVEIGDAQLMGVQKKIIRQARRCNRPVITATQMMESMINAPVPTRAEVFDVANAVLDGTDAVMLSAETATGNYPVQVVAAMANTCEGAEQHPATRISSYRLDRTFTSTQEAIAMSAIYASNHLENISAIICLTKSGSTALLMSRLSSGLPIYGISPHLDSCNRMALYRGVIPLHCDLAGNLQEDIYQKALIAVANTGAIHKGQQVTVTCGEISQSINFTDTLKILEYKG